MSSYFIDSSALVKRYMPETGTVWIRNITAQQSGNDIFVAQITVVEILSAISRVYHDGDIDRHTLQSFRRLVERHMQSQYRVLALSNAIVTQALDLQENHRLRAYDAVQLASALALQHRAAAVGAAITFIASDTRLLQAASSERLQTDTPNNYP
ncbi:MAG: type II toxin-antitoxin system VapC family toxin [Chloroflexota bacterium]